MGPHYGCYGVKPGNKGHNRDHTYIASACYIHSRDWIYVKDTIGLT